MTHDVEMADANIRAFMSNKSKGEVDIVQQARLVKLAGPSLTTPAASWRDLAAYFGQWRNMRVLIGTTLSWFLLDLAFYGLSLNSSLVLAAIGYGSGSSLYWQLYNNTVGLIILAVAGALPGYWTAIFTIDTVGRRNLQIFGFLVLTIIFSIIGFAYERLSSGAILALYIVAQFFFDMGANTTTFIIPGECFPTRYRATSHGISAAAGKMGAIIAQILSIPILARHPPPHCTGTGCSPWLGGLMRLFALFMLCGTLVSLLVPETKGLKLEELAGEKPTSYNAGRNGSIDGPVTRRARRLNPFLGGKPAGFAYPRMGTAKGAWRSSALLPVDVHVKPAPAARRRWWRRGQHTGKRGDHVANTSEDYGMSGASSSSSRAFNDSTEPWRPGADVPRWNAGWGRIDRGAASGDIRLHDVGGLIE